MNKKSSFDKYKLSFNEVVKAVETGEGRYGYAPDIIYHNKKYHMLYCGSGKESGGDTIRYTVSHDYGHRWTDNKAIHYSTNQTKYHFQTCDPSVVYNKTDKYWYLYYSGSYIHTQGAAKGNAYKTLVFLARSKEIQGPYATYTENGQWSKAKNVVPQPIIEPFDKDPDSNLQIYGAGETSVVWNEEKNVIDIWYTDDTNSSDKGKRKMYMRSTLPGKPYLLTDPIDIGVDAESAVVKYHPERKKHYIYYIKDTHRTHASLVKRASSDGGVTWGSEQDVCNQECFPEYANNLGVASDASGYLLETNANECTYFGYGAPVELEYSPIVSNSYNDKSASRWDLYIGCYSEQ